MNIQTINSEQGEDRGEGAAERDIQARTIMGSLGDESERLERVGRGEAGWKYSLAALNLRRVIGTGSNSSVRIAEEKATGRAVALKTMQKSALQSTKNIARVHAEKSILSKLSHPLIVNFYGTFQDLQHLYLIMEYVPGGELYSYMIKRQVLNKLEARFFIAEVAGTLAYLHREGVVYRDLKPENVLIAATGHIKLADFGFAKLLKPGERTYSLCGTPHCMAPEVVSRSGHGFECDWWMLGILLYEMITGSTPFEADTPFEMYSNIITKDFQVPKEADEETASLLRGLLTKDPTGRLSDDEVLHHSFFDGIDWQHLQRIPPSYVPEVKDPLDDSHFDWYTSEEPAAGAVTHQSVFEGYCVITDNLTCNK